MKHLSLLRLGISPIDHLPRLSPDIQRVIQQAQIEGVVLCTHGGNPGTSSTICTYQMKGMGLCDWFYLRNGLQYGRP